MEQGLSETVLIRKRNSSRSNGAPTRTRAILPTPHRTQTLCSTYALEQWRWSLICTAGASGSHSNEPNTLLVFLPGMLNGKSAGHLILDLKRQCFPIDFPFFINPVTVIFVTLSLANRLANRLPPIRWDTLHRSGAQLQGSDVGSSGCRRTELGDLGAGKLPRKKPWLIHGYPWLILMKDYGLALQPWISMDCNILQPIWSKSRWLIRWTWKMIGFYGFRLNISSRDKEKMPCAQTHLRFNGRSRTCPGGIANLGELSADALIATYGLQRVAIVSESSLD